jgi:hypothetical protein
VFALPATNKMDYICNAINQAGFNVHLVSPSWFDDSETSVGYQPQKTIQLSECKKLTFCPSFGTKSKCARNIKILLTLSWLFFWLLKHTKRNEKILVYHVQWLSLPIRWAKKIKGFKMILEVEEIYGDVSVIHPYFHVLEQKLIDSADAFLFSTDLLSQRIDSGKPAIVVYGSYKTYPQLATPPDDGKIHLLYAGIIDTHKAGAFNSVEAARFLPDNYCLHIIGFGEVDLLKQKISEVNQLNGCQVYFDGSLSGDGFIKYCQRCHIGLNTQKMHGKYLDSSFPSKILSYLGLGLLVVSGPIECVRQSKVNHLINYYELDAPESISKSIIKIPLQKFSNNKNVLNKLNIQFVSNLKILISVL